MENRPTTIETFLVSIEEIKARLDPFYYLDNNQEFEGLLLGEFISRIASGKNVKKDLFTDSGTPYLRVQNLKKYDISIGDLFLPIDADFPKTKKGTFLTGRVGTLGVFVRTEDEYYFSDNVLAIEFKEDRRLDLEYLEIILNSSLVNKQILKMSKGNNQKLVSQETIRNLTIPIPPISLQKRVVADFRASINKKVGCELEIKKILADLNKSLERKLGINLDDKQVSKTFNLESENVEGRLDPYYYNPFFKELAKELDRKKAKTLMELVDFSRETWDQKRGFCDNFPYIEISNINTETGEIEKTDLVPIKNAPSRAKMIVRTGDIIVSTTRPNRGAISIINASQSGSIASTGFSILRNIKYKNLDRSYLLAYLRSRLSLLQMEQRATGGNYPAITTEDLSKIKVVLPSLAEQKSISSQIDKSYKKIGTLKEEAKNLLDQAEKRVIKSVLI